MQIIRRIIIFVKSNIKKKLVLSIIIIWLMFLSGIIYDCLENDCPKGLTNNILYFTALYQLGVVAGSVILFGFNWAFNKFFGK